MSAIVVGAGQAGLSVSHELEALGVEPVVIERAKPGQAWRDRWDTFTLVTPNWTMALPGSPYSGSEPEGHVPRDVIVGYLEDYAHSVASPIVEGVDVTRLRADRDGLHAETNDGELVADAVVVCTGSFARQHRPSVLAAVPDSLILSSSEYRNPGQVPAGKVVIVGSGQTGCQIAEELVRSGRDVVLACGRAPWAPRRLDGTDIITWLERTTFFDATVADLPSPAGRFLANPQLTGAGGGHDLGFRTLQALGVRLAGHVAGCDGGRIGFVDDVADSVAFADEWWAGMRAMMRAQLPAKGFGIPEMTAPPPFRCEPVDEVSLRDVGAVVLAAGFRPDYSWIDGDVCDELGFPVTQDGASLVMPGLYFCGVHFMRARRSALLFGVGRDAAIVAQEVAQASA
ncbi:NAD(P)-binding domain-containing protein [Leifsonia shinshuensis]|uniref:NAD(P)-binding domain-containing protein n=1 Tax=Leifsonia shinshuensis TaxID=150026 RepID=UPI001F5067CA|nr:NAD(P)-binding domain-containing protein [Leifsonia shinshuensis]MCI0156291.1 NAD(P)-binding domain-containing protein [Leifsonia shinshuensis]